MAKRPKLAEPEPTIEESMKEIDDGLEEVSFLCEKLGVTFDIDSLAQLYSVVSAVEDVDVFVGGLGLAKEIVVKRMKLAADAPVELDDVLTVFFLSYGDEDDED